MELTSLTYYVAVVQEKSITKAAVKLFISKQALSHVIKKLEEELDVPLFVRTPQGVELTSAGLRFYEYAIEMGKSWKACVNDIHKTKKPHTTELRVGFGYMSYLLWSREIDEDFARLHPHISLTTVGRLSKELLVELDNNRLDAVITCMQGDQHARYEKTLIQQRPLYVLVPSDNPMASKHVITPYDLNGMKLIYSDSGARFMQEMQAFFEELGLSIQVCLTPAGNFFASLKQARDVGGVLLTNDVFRQVAPSIDGFKIIPFQHKGAGELPETRIYALSAKGAPLSSALRQFIEYFYAALLTV